MPPSSVAAALSPGEVGGGSLPRVGWWVAVGVFVAVSLARLAMIPAYELMPMEAYYALYGLHPALSYFDHPPMIGWLLWAPLELLGKSEWSVRLVPWAATVALQLAAWRLLGRFLPRRRRAAAWLLFVTLPVVTGLSLVACPDVPLALFWTLALIALHRAVSGGGPASWLLAGLLMGLAFDSKYVALLLQAGLVLFLVVSPRHRRLLRTPWPYLAIAVAQAVSLPVYLWNLEHGFASFRFQSVERAEHLLRFDLGGSLFVAVHQSALVGPVVFAAFLAACWRAVQSWGRGTLDADRLFLLAFSLPLLLICLAASPFFWVKMNWPLPVYLAGVPLVALAAGRRLFRWQLLWVALFHLALAVELLFYPWPVGGDDTVFGWRQLTRAVEERAARHPEAFLFSTDSYKTPAELRFYGDLEVHGLNVLGEPAYQLDYLGEELTALVGRDALLIDSDRGTPGWGEALDRAFDSCDELEPIVLERRGEPVRRFRVSLCRGYRGPPSPPPSAG